MWTVGVKVGFPRALHPILSPNTQRAQPLADHLGTSCRQERVPRGDAELGVCGARDLDVRCSGEQLCETRQAYVRDARQFR
jgi:hypothetical protein